MRPELVRASDGHEGRKDGVEKKLPSILPSGIADVLNSQGVFTLSRFKRMALAKKIDDLGLTAEDLRMLADYVEAQCGGDNAKAQRTLSGIVTDSTRLVEAVADIRRRPSTCRLALAPGEGIRMANAERRSRDRATWTEEWLSADTRARVRCLLVDRKPDDVILKDTGCDITVLAEVRAELEQERKR